jgi:hypothetical protein
MFGIVLLYLDGNCQTFSVRGTDDLLSVYSSVLNQPFGYQVIGVRVDTIDGYHFNTIVRNFNFEGDQLETKNYYYPNKTYDPTRDNNARLNDTTTVTVVTDIEDGNDTIYSTVIWLTNVGDTLQTRRFSSPYYIPGVNNTNFILPTSIICSPDGESIYFVSQIFHSTSQNNFMIKKLTAQGDEVWTYLNPLNNDYQYCDVIQYFNDSLWYVIAGWGDNAYNKLVELNIENHQIEQQIELIPGEYVFSYAEEMAMDQEGVVVAGIEWEGSSTFLPSVYKMDYLGNLLWTEMPDGDSGLNQQNNHLVKSTDGGYVSCSVKYDEQTNPADPNDPSSNNTSEKIWLWKVNSDGEFEWQRFYEYLSFDSGYFYLNNTALDMKATPDGGFIMAGEATASCLEWPCLAGDPFTQQGWLLKVDGCGCLVPGCDESCIVDVAEQEDGSSSDTNRQYMKVGPNPASDVLHIYLSSLSPNQSSGCHIQLHDLQGNVIRSLHLKQDDTTYIIDTASLPNGEYILSLMSAEKDYENMLLQTEKIVVAH